MNNLVSVVIPIYNVEKYIFECVDSAVAQTYQNVELLLVDDGTPDECARISDEYCLNDERIVTIHRKNGGLSAARNTGMDAASGEYIYFLDSDDYILPGTIVSLIETAYQEKADVVFFDGETFYDGCERPEKEYSYFRECQYLTKEGRAQLQELLKSGEYRTAVPLNFFSAAYLRENSLRFMENVVHEDEHFSFLVFMANGSVAHCHENLYFRRVRPGSIMTSGKAQFVFNSMLMIYNDLSGRYHDSDFVCETSRMYLVRTAKGVIAKYNLLDDDGKADCQKVYQSFRKSVMRFHGFGDLELRIKCSDGLANFVYRLENKLCSRMR